MNNIVNKANSGNLHKKRIIITILRFIPLIFGLGALVWLFYMVAIDESKIRLIDKFTNNLIYPFFVFVFVLLLNNIIFMLDYTKNMGEIDKTVLTINEKMESAKDEYRKAHDLLECVSAQKNYLKGITPISVAVSNFNDFFIYAPFLVAIAYSCFDNEELQVSSLQKGNDDKAFNALLNGAVPFAITDPGMVVDNDECFVIAPIVNKAALWGVSKNSDIITLDKSKKYKVITYQKPSTAYLLVDRLKNNKELDMDIESFNDYKLFDEPNKIYDDFDITFLTEPERTWFKVKNSIPDENEINIHDILYPNLKFNFTAVMTTKKVAETNPELIKRFLRSLNVAYKIIYCAKYANLSSSFDEIVNAVKKQCEEVYKQTPIFNFFNNPDNFETIKKMFAYLVDNDYFPKTIFYNDELLKGLEEAITLRLSAKDYSVKKSVDITRKVSFNLEKEVQLIFNKKW